MPCNPSAPPVSHAIRLAISPSSATPSVTINRVRSVPRSTRKLVAKPSDRGRRRSEGEALQRIGGHMFGANRPATYAPSPKNAACPSETTPA